MADSLLDIGGESEFPLEIDWSTLPSHDFQITRYLFEARGTASKIEEQNPESPINFEAAFLISTREMEYTFLDFIHTQIGRTKRFWLRYPKTMFQLTEGLSTGSVVMKCEPNNFDLFHVGHERIFIELNNGDTITRHISNAVYDSANDEVDLTLATAIDRDIAVSDVYMIGRYLLMRFDNDDFDLEILATFKQEITLKFVELIRDYEDLAANP